MALATKAQRMLLNTGCYMLCQIPKSDGVEKQRRIMSYHRNPMFVEKLTFA